MRHRLAAAGLIGCVMVLGACARQTVLLDNPPTQSNPPVRTFDAHGLRFEYPGTWITFDAPTPAPAASGQPPPVQPQRQATEVVGLDELNNVSVAYGVPLSQATDFETWSAQIKANLTASVEAHSMVLLAGPDVIRTAGLPALRYDTRVPSGFGYNLVVTWVGFVRGSTQFVVECRSLPERSAEIQRGCQQILATLEIG
jgi:hypothetical protein